MYGTPASASRPSAAHGLGELHQRQRAFLHARAARRRDDDQRQSLGERVLGGARDLLADDRAHRAAHEGEVHGAHRDARAADRARAPHGRVAHAGRGPRRRQALGVWLLVDEARACRPIRGPASCSWKLSRSSSRASRASTRSRKWCPQRGQTRWLLSSCLVVEHLLAVGALRPEIRGICSSRRPPKGSLIGISPASDATRAIAAAPIDTPGRQARRPSAGADRARSRESAAAIRPPAARSCSARRSSNRNEGWKRGRPLSSSRMTWRTLCSGAEPSRGSAIGRRAWPFSSASM